MASAKGLTQHSEVISPHDKHPFTLKSLPMLGTPKRGSANTLPLSGFSTVTHRMKINKY